MIIHLHSTNEEMTIEAGAALAARLRGGDVLSLEGELGSGKTCLARGIAQGLGIDAREISSPTFAIAHVHDALDHCLYHLDAFRLAGPEDLASIGWEEMLADVRGVVLCEWGQRIHKALPPSRLEVHLEHAGEQQRGLALHVPDADATRFDGLWT